MTTAAEFEQILRAERLLVVVRAASNLVDIVEELHTAGIALVEISLTSPDALRTISVLAGRFPVGAGTVRTVGDARQAVEAGATFLVSPSSPEDVLDWKQAADIPHIPGVLTPNDIEAVRRRGIHLAKLFPALLGGPDYLSALRGPFPEMGFVPTGGVDGENIRAYLHAGAAAVAIGGALTQAPDIATAARHLTSLARLPR
jgi:2-dehydro-3-deoxyphosphogluconate aldolase / (4S)-4-hydroxy-2-oxoglutarate aldolase